MSGEFSASFVVISVVLSTIVLGTIVGNVFVIMAILIDKNLQTTANQLVLSLAVADLMVACLVMPLGAYNDLYQGWYLGKEVCEFWTSADVLCCTASILNLLAIALDRYWAVTSVDYIYRRTRRRVNMMILYAWTVGAVVSLAPIFGWKDPDFANRVLHEHKCLVSQDVAYQIFATISTFYAPLVLLLGLYWRIFQVARKRIRRKPGRNELIKPSTITTNTDNNNNNKNDKPNYRPISCINSLSSPKEEPLNGQAPSRVFGGASDMLNSAKNDNNSDEMEFRNSRRRRIGNGLPGAGSDSGATTTKTGGGAKINEEKSAKVNLLQLKVMNDGQQELQHGDHNDKTKPASPGNRLLLHSAISGEAGRRNLWPPNSTAIVVDRREVVFCEGGGDGGSGGGGGEGDKDNFLENINEPRRLKRSALKSGQMLGRAKIAPSHQFQSDAGRGQCNGCPGGAQLVSAGEQAACCCCNCDTCLRAYADSSCRHCLKLSRADAKESAEEIYVVGSSPVMIESRKSAARDKPAPGQRRCSRDCCWLEASARDIDASLRGGSLNNSSPVECPSLADEQDHYYSSVVLPGVYSSCDDDGDDNELASPRSQVSPLPMVSERLDRRQGGASATAKIKFDRQIENSSSPGCKLGGRELFDFERGQCSPLTASSDENEENEDSSLSASFPPPIKALSARALLVETNSPVPANCCKRPNQNGRADINNASVMRPRSDAKYSCARLLAGDDRSRLADDKFDDQIERAPKRKLRDGQQYNGGNNCIGKSGDNFCAKSLSSAGEQWRENRNNNLVVSAAKQRQLGAAGGDSEVDRQTSEPANKAHVAETSERRPDSAGEMTNSLRVEPSAETSGQIKSTMRSLDLRRKFKALGQLVSFVQTSKGMNSASSSALNSDLSSLNHEEDRASGGAIAADQRRCKSTATDNSDNSSSCSMTTGRQLGASNKLSGDNLLADGSQTTNNNNKPNHLSLELANKTEDSLKQRAASINQTNYCDRKRQQSNTGELALMRASGRRRERENMEIRREKKAAKTLAIITGVFVCCWLPFFLNAIVMPVCGLACTPSDLILSILLWLGYLNSLLNPIIYTIFSPDFRRAFRRILYLEH